MFKKTISLLFVLTFLYSCSTYQKDSRRFIASSLDSCMDPYIDKSLLSPDRAFQRLGTETYGLSPSQVSYADLKPLSQRKVQDVEDVLKNGEIISTEYLGGGVNTTSVVTLRDGRKAVWKPHQESYYSNYRAEVLAYEIDQKFGFNLVPPTVERKIGDYKGSMQLFMESKSSNEFLSKTELNRQSFFDFVIDNRDRHDGNYLASPIGKVISIDNGLAFTGKGHNMESFFRRREGIAEFFKTSDGHEIIEKFRHIDWKKFEIELKSYLGEADALRLKKRVEFSIKYYDDLK